MKNKLLFKVFVLGVTLTGLGVFLGYQATITQVDKDLKFLNQKINVLFQDKQIITDGQKTPLEGDLDKKGRVFSLLTGGFSVYELSKKNNGFVKTKWIAGNLSYENGEKDPIWGYLFSFLRPTIQACYDNSFELLTKGTEEAGLNLSYTPNKYTEIKDFPTGYYSKYHSVKQRYLDEPAQLGKLSTTACSVEYYHSTGFYTIQKHEEVIEKTLIKNMSLYSIIGLSLAIAIAFLLRYILPYSGKSESLFNKKWKNIESNSILMIEAKMFGRNKVVLTENDKAKKGIAKIADNGSTIQLSFIDSDYFYKVQHLSLFKLELENLVSNTIVKYEILGSNAYPKKEV